MNHDDSASSPARATPTPPRQQLSPDDVGDTVPPQNGDASRRARSLSRSANEPRRRRKKKSKKKRNPGLVRKLAFVTHLLRTLDILFFAELSSLYYMECSLFRFILRSAGQYMYLTPKDESFPFFMPATRVHVLLVVIPNIICVLLHLFGSLPTGPDFHRGYQHGGIIIDFIGQKPATSRLYYVLADVVILAVQCFMLAVHTERERLRVLLKTFRPLLPEVAQEMETARSPDDLDAEERGVAVDASNGNANETDEVEMRRLDGAEGEPGGTNDNPDASEPLLRDASGDDAPRTHLSDIMASGNAVIGEYHVLHSIRTAALDLERAAAHSLQTISYGATMAALQARRRRGINLQARSRRQQDGL